MFRAFYFRSISLFLLCILSLSLSQPSIKGNNPDKDKLNDFSVLKKVEWAKPAGISLTMDIYTPKSGKAKYPVLIIFHGGGWLINNNTVMDSMSTYIVQHGEYVVCNVNYRLLGDNNNVVTMNQMIEDAMGAVLWIKEHIAEYGGDNRKIVVTGDSAGGHLAAMVILGSDKLESDGFGGPSLGYKPTYLPSGKTPEYVKTEKALDIQGAILSYPALDIYNTCLGGFEAPGNFFWKMAGKTPRGIFLDTINVKNNPEYYKTVSPIYNIPKASERRLPPQLCLVGSNDNLITPASVQHYADLIAAAGHKVQVWVHEGRPHAFLDSWKNQYLGTEFRKDAPPALDKMLEFMNNLFQN
jgi:acetyl esterase/lipase